MSKYLNRWQHEACDPKSYHMRIIQMLREYGEVTTLEFLSAFGIEEKTFRTHLQIARHHLRVLGEPLVIRRPAAGRGYMLVHNSATVDAAAAGRSIHDKTVRGWVRNHAADLHTEAELTKNPALKAAFRMREALLNTIGELEQLHAELEEAVEAK